MPKVDLAKRRRVMQRSKALGHCICEPRRPCPCDVFTDQGICPCAGERPDPAPAGDVKLTQLVRNAGCASKIAPADLEQILGRLPVVDDPAVLSGIPAGDDAGIYALTDDVSLVQTVDVFTPCVDDPFTFGRICAANCLSDIYAMGGVPRTALSIVGFPAETLDGRIMYEMMKGAMEALAAAGVALIGGHSIKDEEIKLGFAITGTIDAAAVERQGANVDDMLVLTKPLGTGVLSFAHQIGRSHAAGLAQAEASMIELNGPAAEAMREAGASACTDVTGFGLFGHLAGMVRDSQVTAHVFADTLPAFDGALEALAEGVIPGAIERNSEYVGDDIRVSGAVDPARFNLGFDAQTSGGLLIAIGADHHPALLEALASRGIAATTVGTIVAESSGRIAVTQSNESPATAGLSFDEDQDMPKHDSDQKQPASPCCGPAGDATSDSAATEGPCCADASAADASSGTSADSLAAFGALMRATGSDGAIDGRTKELINFALVVMARCQPCVAAHVTRARSLGISQAELDEAAWCAIAMGGAPVRMFYEQTKG